jgi:hypothetical protein
MCRNERELISGEDGPRKSKGTDRYTKHNRVGRVIRTMVMLSGAEAPITATDARKPNL